MEVGVVTGSSAGTGWVLRALPPRCGGSPPRPNDLSVCTMQVVSGLYRTIRKAAAADSTTSADPGERCIFFTDRADLYMSVNPGWKGDVSSIEGCVSMRGARLDHGRPNWRSGAEGSEIPEPKGVGVGAGHVHLQSDAKTITGMTLAGSAGTFPASSLARMAGSWK